MKKETYIENLYSNLNAAFSINYMVLQNIDRMTTKENNMVFLRNDIFGEKSSAQQFYEEYFYDLAKIRNDFFEEITNVFSPDATLKQFRNNAEYLLEEYNKAFNKDVRYSHIFSERDVKNWGSFNKIIAAISDAETSNNLKINMLKLALATFLIFYNTYSEWISSYEIFETLDTDITTYGNKSLLFGNPENKNIIKLKKADYQTYFGNIINQLPLKYRIGFLNKKTPEKDEDILKAESANTIRFFLDKLDSRFEYASKHLILTTGNIMSKLQYWLSHMSDGNFNVDEVYVHKNELLSLISAMETFPQLENLSDEIYSKFCDEPVDFLQNMQK